MILCVRRMVLPLKRPRWARIVTPPYVGIRMAGALIMPVMPLLLYEFRDLINEMMPCYPQHRQRKV